MRIVISCRIKCIIYRYLSLVALFAILITSITKLGWAKSAHNQVMSACARPIFLKAYEQAGLVEHKSDDTILLYLDADQHSADCGAPDCYGTKLIINMKSLAVGQKCVIRNVQVRTLDYFGAGCKEAGATKKPHSDRYRQWRGHANLNNPSLNKLTLRSKDRTHAIVLLKNNFFYFDQVAKNGVLHTQLQSEDDADSKCCWGATSSHMPLVLQHSPGQGKVK